MVNVQSVFNTKGSTQIWASIWSILGVVFIVLFFVNVTFKNSSALKQGLYDTLFGAYLVKHVPVAGEETSAFIAKLESMGSYGDRYSKRQAEKKVKREEKAKAAEEERALLAESPGTGAEEPDVNSEDSASKSDSAPEDKSE